MAKKSNIFLIAGRTGGPFFPLPTVAKNLSKFTPVYIGMRGGFEQIALSRSKQKLEFLPDIRLTLLTFKKEKISETIANYVKFIITIIKSVFALFKSILLVLKYKPKIIYTTGSFLAIPIVFSARFTNFLGFTQSKIVVHQQDPDPGISNKFAVKYANKVSCVFEYTRQNYTSFKNAETIPNPIEESLYDFSKNPEFANLELVNFFKTQSPKPTLLIFGGGSGSEDINVWTLKNIIGLLDKFRIIHLTGILQKKKFDTVDSPDYLRFEVLLEDMRLALFKSDLVLCRAGMASITELEFLQKPAFLVPLPTTHQEKNAELVADKFFILHQKDRPSWLKTITDNYPEYFKNITFESKTQKIQRQQNYFKSLNLL